MQVVCGVDVSKAWLDAHVAPAGVSERFANTAEGVAELSALCTGHGVELVVMEASGGFERLAFTLLWAGGQSCALANPRQVRSFAQAMGQAEKTDRIDAAVIARFCLARKLAPTPLPGQSQTRLRALVGRLGQVTADMVVNKQRISATNEAEALESLGEVVALLKRQERHLAGEIASLIDDDPLWAALDHALRSVKGVADRTVARLMAELPEIGTISNKAIAKLAGLAPMADESGARRGRRHVQGGRAGPRSILYLVADIARRFHPGLAAFHERLKAAGKAKMVIRIALARKLLVILNAKARDARKEYANAT